MKPTKNQLKEYAINAIESNSEKIIAIGDAIYEEPELGYKEEKTAAKVKKVFDELNFKYRDEVAISGVVADLRGAESKLKVAVMGELDAVISPANRCADLTTGAAHTCGHNAMIAALIGVAYALGTTDIMRHLSGDVALMAIPAEEFVEIEYRKGLIDAGKIRFMGGKQEFIYLGEFDDIDLALMFHNDQSGQPGQSCQSGQSGQPNQPGQSGQSNQPNQPQSEILASAGYTSIGFVGKFIQYIGKAAHAGASPHLGINALNAASIGLTAVNYQRETFKDEDSIRIHPIITKGGALVNVVPDDVRIETFVRGANMEAILDAEMKVDRAFRAGGDAVGAKTNIESFPGYLPLVMCDPLMDIMFENQKQVLGADRVIYKGPSLKGSTDAGDLSYILPTLHAGFGGLSGPLHTDHVEVIDKEVAYISPAKSLVMTVIDLLYDGAGAGLDVKKDFKPIMTKDQYLRDWGKL